MDELASSVSLADDEIQSVESFRRLKDTAVLTIMFTDIQGFTQLTDQKGERHSSQVRALHDEVVEGIITRGNAGLIVKRIGDAVMAVFSEPSTAVERALEIQSGLDVLNGEHPELDPLKVRVGLDMGQVTVDDRVDVDVFGRHVNRAARVEGLAQGGQVYMSYTVFDSAVGWLKDSSKGYEWASHGRYRLKGVSSPLEVFEVVDGQRSEVSPPKSGNRVRSVPGLAWAAGFVLVGIAGTVGYLQFEKTEVFLTEYKIPLSYLDRSTEVLLDDETEDDDSRKLLAEVRPGKHILHYDVADGVRYYAEFDVVRGENRLRPEWKESRLPSIYRYIELGDEPIVGVTRSEQYFVYDANNERIDYDSEIVIGINLASDPEDPETLMSTLSWKVTLNGTALADETRTFRTAIAGETIEETVEVHTDEFQRYWVKTRFVGRYAHLEVNSALAPLGG